MNILLSAYTCHPSYSTEFSHGWNWACELANAGHQVWVLTAPIEKAGIESVLDSISIPALRIVYVDQPSFAAWSRFGAFGVIAHSILWQRSALTVARELSSKVDFDIVHHVTWGSLHVGSRLWRLGKPFIFGPVGGGQVAPYGFRRYLRGGWTMELIRSVVVHYLTGTLLYARSTVAHANLVLVANEDTHAWVKRLGAARVEEMLDIGTKELPIAPNAKRRSCSDGLKVLWVGRLLPRKGVLLALEALARVDPRIAITCTILGDGKQGRYLPGWIKQLGLSDRVVWRGNVPWSEALATYLSHDIFLFTSLRDTVGSQLIEAMARGNVIVTLDHHGARVAVPDNAGIKVPVTTPRKTAEELARAIESLAKDPEKFTAMSQKALEAAASYTWASKIERAISLYGLISGGTDDDQVHVP